MYFETQINKLLTFVLNLTLAKLKEKFEKYYIIRINFGMVFSYTYPLGKSLQGSTR